jgi:hypothetical protein
VRHFEIMDNRSYSKKRKYRPSIFIFIFIFNAHTSQQDVIYKAKDVTLLTEHTYKSKVKFNIEQAMKAQIGNRGIALLFL